jgi:hypothetical protein
LLGAWTLPESPMLTFLPRVDGALPVLSPDAGKITNSTAGRAGR